MNAVTHFTHSPWRTPPRSVWLREHGVLRRDLLRGAAHHRPRLAWPRLIAAHFWLAAIGIAIYFVSLTIGGWLQGSAMLDEDRGFMESVALTLPYLKGRSVGGA